MRINEIKVFGFTIYSQLPEFSNKNFVISEDYGVQIDKDKREFLTILNYVIFEISILKTLSKFTSSKNALIANQSNHPSILSLKERLDFFLIINRIGTEPYGFAFSKLWKSSVIHLLNSVRKRRAHSILSREFFLSLLNRRPGTATFAAPIVGTTYLPLGRTSKCAIRGNTEIWGLPRALKNLNLLIEKQNSTEIQVCQNSKFAVITHSLPSGGAEKQSILLVSALRRARIESELFLLDHLTIRNSTHLSICQSKGVEPVLCKMSNLENLQFINLEDSLVSDLLNPHINPYALELANLLDMLLKHKINVIISSLDGNNIVALMASVILNLKIHISFRSYAPDRMSHVNQEHAKQLYQTLIKYKGIVFSGNSRLGNKDYARYLNISETEIPIIDNFLDENLRSQANLPLDLEQKLEIDVLGVMRLASEKNPVLFLQYCAEINKLNPKATFVLVGDGPMMGVVKKEIMNLNLEKNLSFIENANIENLLNLTKSVMLTSNFEGTPNIVLESMAKGLPVFATKVGEISNLLADGRGFLLNPSRISKDVQQIVKILDSSKIRMEIGTTSKKFIATWPNDSDLVNAFISDLSR